MVTKSREQKLVERFITGKKRPFGKKVTGIIAKPRLVGTTKFIPKRRKFTQGGVFDV